MKKSLVCSLLTLFVLMLSGSAQAALETIGAAQYNGAFYGMIYDDDLNLVWLDYTNTEETWPDKKDWAASLNTEGTLRYAWFPEYANFTWTEDWRLPSTLDGPYQSGHDGTTTVGFNITSSEMGHLYYTELGNLGYYDTNGDFQSGWGLENTGDFENLIASWYWSGTEFAIDPVSAWFFGMDSGYQGYDDKSNGAYGLAVRSGQVSTSPVPVPGALLLLGSGLLSIAGISRKRNQ